MEQFAAKRVEEMAKERKMNEKEQQKRKEEIDQDLHRQRERGFEG